jgi:hypothetical protein
LNPCNEIICNLRIARTDGERPSPRPRSRHYRDRARVRTRGTSGFATASRPGSPSSTARRWDSEGRSYPARDATRYLSSTRSTTATAAPSRGRDHRHRLLLRHRGLGLFADLRLPTLAAIHESPAPRRRARTDGRPLAGLRLR